MDKTGIHTRQSLLPPASCKAHWSLSTLPWTKLGFIQGSRYYHLRPARHTGPYLPCHGQNWDSYKAVAPTTCVLQGTLVPIYLAMDKTGIHTRLSLLPPASCKAHWSLSTLPWTKLGF